jgi:ATP-dependent DNA helicase RecG
MAQHQYEQLLVRRGHLNHAWEDLPAIEYSIDDLDCKEIQDVIAEGVERLRIPNEALNESIENVLQNRLNLLEVDGVLNNAAIVLFGKENAIRLHQCEIKLARFDGLEKYSSNFIDSINFKGNAFKIVSTANQFIMRHIPVASFFEENNFQRKDKPALPALALREALINAVVHRDYSYGTAPIYLAIYNDRLELWNNAVLAKQIEIKKFKELKHSYLHNKKIANVFYKRGLIEAWGSGINKMIELCKKDDLPEPEFQERFGTFGVTFKFKKPIISFAAQYSVYKVRLSVRQENILAIIRAAGAVSVQHIMAKLSNPPSLRMVRKDLNYLKLNRLIELKGASKGDRKSVV